MHEPQLTPPPTSKKQFLKFMAAWATNPLRTGAVVPSSADLGRAMTQAVLDAGIGKVVELGPGTGVVTRQLLAGGIAEQDLTLVELSPKFAADLHQRFPQANVLNENAITFVERLALEPRAEPLAIVSSLPLLHIPLNKRQAFYRNAVLGAGGAGVVVQFTYSLAPPSRAIAGVKMIRDARVWRNFPPASVWVFSSTTN